jgi:hypothetical protein
MALNIGNQTLGRGKILFSLFKQGTHTPAGFRYVGNTPSFNLTISQDKLDHFSSDAGVRVKDKSIILQVDYSGNLVMDDLNSANLSLFFFGNQSTLSQTSATAQSESFTGTTQGYAYQLGMTTGNPTGVRQISNVVVTVSASSKTLGTDYTIDAARGTITVVEGGTIADGSTMAVTYDRAAVSRKQVISGTTQVEGALRFESYNPQGEKNDFYMPYVRLGPNGDFELKSDEWQQLPCSVEILADPAYSREAIYIDGQPFVPA